MTTDGNENTLALARTLKVALATRMFGASAKAVGTAAAADHPRSYLSAIPDWSNIVGFGYGAKWTSNGMTSDDAVRIYVRAKAPRRDLSADERVPDDIDGVPTDVVAVGEITPAARPVPCGVSGGHRDINVGTLGCLVSRDGAGSFILSNNHVLANFNTGHINDPILEPSVDDNGAVNPPIAQLAAFKTLVGGGGINEIDAAIARLVNSSDMTADIKSIGFVNRPTIAPMKRMSVMKHGRTTRHTMGVIDDLAADVRISYPGLGRVHFEDQIAVKGVGGRFADRGDSGSLVVDALQTRPVALVFAVGSTRTFCNYIDKVLAEFHAAIL